jgi:hypothetical protein
MALRVSIEPAHGRALRDILTRMQMRRAPQSQRGHGVTADKGDYEAIVQALDVIRQAMTAGHVTFRPPLFADPRFRALTATLLTPGNVERTQQACRALRAYMENI